MNESKKMYQLSGAQIICFSFLFLLGLGTFLLCLPISFKGACPPFVDVLFTATSATCITGLMTVNVLATWSTFGQVVLLGLIQLGGLGVITFASVVMIILGKRLSLSNRLLIQESYSLSSFQGVVKLIRRIVRGTLVVEGIGAFFLTFSFVPRFGIGRGIWVSVFTSVSAFCNAGIDIINDCSLKEYVHSPLVSIVIMILITLGGLGFVVWWDVYDRLKEYFMKKTGKKAIWKKLSVHSKIVFATSGILIIGGAILFFCFEYHNEATMGSFSFGEKVLASFFQSVTTRTAGFEAISQGNLHNNSVFLTIILMFIGGSPVGTAGGVKTMVVALMFLTMCSVIRGRHHTVAFKRTISKDVVRRSSALLTIAFMALILITMLMANVENKEFISLLYESASALGTVGLTMNVTPSLSLAGKLIIIVTMFIGRIGPISLAMAFNKKGKGHPNLRYPEEDVLVG